MPTFDMRQHLYASMNVQICILYIYIYMLNIQKYIKFAEDEEDCVLTKIQDQTVVKFDIKSVRLKKQVQYELCISTPQPTHDNSFARVGKQHFDRAG